MSIGKDIGEGVASFTTGMFFPTFDRVRDAKWRSEDIARAESLTREQWARDDSAIQRRVVDMKAAGINPLLAAGSAASSSQPLYSSRGASGAGNADPYGMLMAKENIATSRAQRTLLLAQIEKLKAETAHISGSDSREQGVYNHNMSILGNVPYGQQPQFWGALLGIARDFYNGKYKDGKGSQAIEKFADDISKTGLGKAEAEQIARSLENAERAQRASDTFQKSQKSFWDWLNMGFNSSSSEMNHY